MNIDLLSIISHEKFVVSKNYTELKHNIGKICVEISGIKAEEKSIQSQTIAIIKRFKKQKKGLGIILKCEKETKFVRTKYVRLERENKCEVISAGEVVKT